MFSLGMSIDNIFIDNENIDNIFKTLVTIFHHTDLPAGK